MILNMLTDLTSFVVFIFTLLIGFGLAYQGLLEPTTPFDTRKFFNVFYRYFL